MPDTRTAPFRRAVIGINGGPTDILAVRLACQLARPTKAALVGVHVVEVDWTRDLSEDVASDNEAASAVLDRAEAASMEAALVIVGLPYRKKFGGDFAIGRTIPSVLQNAPCEVLVVREPIASHVARGREPGGAVGAGLGPSDRL